MYKQDQEIRLPKANAAFLSSGTVYQTLRGFQKLSTGVSEGRCGLFVKIDTHVLSRYFFRRIQEGRNEWEGER